eukprot:TRINITY_DN2736_c0_g1_i4.p1 TRINITY_DN2736_c0_g1~~TRINITY_DN2736_c0_g1_i4.p1  ORF type:complete len:720 (-),score=112.44 TRINITY_DN2736_c0_g1_i4:39-2198(-)
MPSPGPLWSLHHHPSSTNMIPSSSTTVTMRSSRRTTSTCTMTSSLPSPPPLLRWCASLAPPSFLGLSNGPLGGVGSTTSHVKVTPSPWPPLSFLGGTNNAKCVPLAAISTPSRALSLATILLPSPRHPSRSASLSPSPPPLPLPILRGPVPLTDALPHHRPRQHPRRITAIVDIRNDELSILSRPNNVQHRQLLLLPLPLLRVPSSPPPPLSDSLISSALISAPLQYTIYESRMSSSSSLVCMVVRTLSLDLVLVIFYKQEVEVAAVKGNNKNNISFTTSTTSYSTYTLLGTLELEPRRSSVLSVSHLSHKDLVTQRRKEFKRERKRKNAVLVSDEQERVRALEEESLLLRKEAAARQQASSKVVKNTAQQDVLLSYWTDLHHLCQNARSSVQVCELRPFPPPSAHPPMCLLHFDDHAYGWKRSDDVITIQSGDPLTRLEMAVSDGQHTSDPPISGPSIIAPSMSSSSSLSRVMYSDLVHAHRSTIQMRSDFVVKGAARNKFIVETVLSRPDICGIIVESVSINSSCYASVLSRSMTSSSAVDYDPTNNYIQPPPYLYLSRDSRRIRDTPNAGGNSIWSEAMSIELLHMNYGAVLKRTEMEIEYHPYSKITDYEVDIMGHTVAVSVTRAIDFTDLKKKHKAPFSAEDAKTLLRKKLQGVLMSSAGVVQAWERQILHVWTTSTRVTDLIVHEFIHEIDPALRANTLVIVSQCNNGMWIFE